MAKVSFSQYSMWSSCQHQYKLAYIDDTYKNCIKIQEHINRFYLTKTNINKKMLKDLLIKDLQFNAEECINMGVADSIYMS